MIDVATAQLRPVHDVIRERIGKRVSPATLWRWRLKGVNGVRLECVRVGGTWYTTNDAFADFLIAQTANTQEPESSRAQQQHSRSPEMERRLRAAGLL